MTTHTAITPWAIAESLSPWVVLALAGAVLVVGAVCVATLLGTTIWQREINGKDVASTAAAAVAAHWLATVIGDLAPGPAWWSQPLTTGWDTAYATATVALTVAQPLLTLVTAAAAIGGAAVTMVWLSGRMADSGAAPTSSAGGAR